MTVAGAGPLALVVPDVPALQKQFVYSIPPELAGRVEVGTQVRVDVHGRRVAGWTVELVDTAPEGVNVRPLAAVRGIGPPAPVVDIARWAAWRFAGALAFGLKTASSPRVVGGLPPLPGSARSARPGEARGVSRRRAVWEEALDAHGDGSAGESVVRIGPTGDRLDLLFAAADLLEAGDRGGVLVLAPTHVQAAEASRRLVRAGYPVALLPGDWAGARSGGRVAVGTMAAAFAPLERLKAAVVLDAHEEAYYAEAAPTWCAWRVVAERARRDRAPLVLVSPCPTLDVSSRRKLVTRGRATERHEWPLVEVVDQRDEDPRAGLFSERLVRLARWAAEDTRAPGGTGRRVVCILNRKGRARLLACTSCKQVARCERCRSAVEVAAGPKPQGLVCTRCGLGRPQVCAECGSTRLSVLRPGVTRVREELEAIAGTQVEELTGPQARAQAEDPVAHSRLIVGTEAALHRVDHAEAVVFLDFDQELLAPRLRAAEEALALVARAARIVGRNRHGGDRPPGAPIVIQTRMPEHPAVESATRGDPSILERAELELRRALELPPFSSLARITGDASDEYGAGLVDAAEGRDGVEVIGPHDGEWRVVARDETVLCDLLASVRRPSKRLRIEVDPVRA